MHYACVSREEVKKERKVFGKIDEKDMVGKCNLPTMSEMQDYLQGYM